MKRNATDRWAIVLSILLLGILRFLYGRWGWNVAAPAVVNNDANIDIDAIVDDADGWDELPSWYTYLQKNDYTNTTALADFGTDEVITRATSTPFLARYGFVSKLEEKSSTDECDFPDVANKSDDLQKTITVACAYDLLRWSNGNFIPDRVMSKDELLTVLVRTKTWFLAEDATPWYKNYFDWAITNWLVDAGTSITEFSWDVTKADLGQWLYRLSLID